MKTMLLSVLLALLAGCMTRESANIYGRHEAGREQTVRYGTVDAVRKVTIEGSQTGVGGAAGGIGGAIAGGSVGQGRGSAVAGVLGAVAGGVAGNAIEGASTQKAGLEITVKLDSGELRAIVQEADEPFQPGQRVRLLSSGGITRVTPN
jgi:outer membrane lipoprotein SlyB